MVMLLWSMPRVFAVRFSPFAGVWLGAQISSLPLLNSAVQFCGSSAW
jgi:hypothetical protein